MVSNASDTGYYEDRFGVKIVPVAQEELEDLFLATTREQAATYFDWFTGHSQGCVEPTQEDIWNASRMACALVTLLEKYHAAGAALACFNLLRTGTNACLGAVSFFGDDRFWSVEWDSWSRLIRFVISQASKQLTLDIRDIVQGNFRPVQQDDYAAGKVDFL